ncbi:hypothetical protein H5410_015202 [Solanum commersonii]|uniref:Uncharacterized protein n=1 Tax=Solanum commersonii TaxID=4109 RepID=A0A9J5ZTP7_SOLCO|nr:hypothetical protein H5410_015202 [Solanum commersonii]
MLTLEPFSEDQAHRIRHISNSLVCVSRRVEWGAHSQCSEHTYVEKHQKRALPTKIKDTVFHEHIKNSGFGHPLIHAGPCPELIDGPVRHRSTSDQGSRYSGAVTLFGTPFQETLAQSSVEDASLEYNSDDGAAQF